MYTASPDFPRPRQFVLLLVLLLTPVQPTALHAAPPRAAHPPREFLVAAAVDTGSSVLVGGIWKSFLTFLENNLNNRRRMIQFAVLGMCLALYIMIWRR